MKRKYKVYRKFITYLYLPFIISLGFVTIISSGGGGGGGSSSSNFGYTYRVPDQINDGWTVGDLSATSVDVDLIENMISSIKRGESKQIHSVLIVLGGELVLEEYFYDYDRNMNHRIASITKSFTSALIGIAMDQGLISSVDQPLFSFFPEYSHLNNNAKNNITLYHVLTMTAGLKWDEWTYPYSSTQNDHYKLRNSNDWYGFVLSRNSIFSPGDVFVYNSGLSMLLGGIIANTSGMTADVFAETHLFGPLGIDSYEWWQGPKGEIHTSDGLYIKPRDMAKLGQLYIDKGTWNGTRVISEEWVNESTARHLTFDDTSYYLGYGYQWWWFSFEVNGTIYETYTAFGAGVEYIFVFDELDMVVVFTAAENKPERGPGTAYSYTKDYVLPAVLPKP